MSADEKNMPKVNVVHFGGCHCGNVRFQVAAPAALQCIECRYARLPLSNMFLKV